MLEVSHREGVFEEYWKEASRYRTIGRAFVELSNLERIHDDFVLVTRRHHRVLADKLTTHFPRHFREKTDFLIGAIVAIPRLRMEPIFDDGSLSLQWLQCQLDELYDVRTVLAHGSVFTTDQHDTHTIWKFDRYRSGRAVEPVIDWSHEIGDGFLCDLWYTARRIKFYISGLRNILEDYSHGWESDYQWYKEARGRTVAVDELVADGIIDEAHPLNKFRMPRRE